MTKRQTKPTDSEVEILGILWELGPTTVRAVHSQLSQKRDLGYTTTLKLMQIMVEKGLLTRDESQRSHVYRPRQRAETTQRNILKDLISKAFAGSTEKLVMQALSAKPTTPEQIAEIRRMLDELETEKD